MSKKNRINWSVWESNRDGSKVYDGDPIMIDRPENPNNPILINPGDSVGVTADTTFWAISYTYSFVNTAKFEAWLGGGLNFQTIDYTVRANIGTLVVNNEATAEGTIPIPTLNFGGRWNFSPSWRALFTADVFGLDIGDYSGRLNNTRLLVEYNIIKHFGIGVGLERYSFEVNAESDDFIGSLDISYTGLSLYLKGQF